MGRGRVAVLGSVLAVLAVAGPAHAVTVIDYEAELGAPAGTHAPYFITTGPDGTLWYTDAATGAGGGIGRLNTSGTRLFAIQSNTPTFDLLRAPDGSMYWTAPSSSSAYVRAPDGKISTGGPAVYRKWGITFAGGRVLFGYNQVEQGMSYHGICKDLAFDCNYAAGTGAPRPTGLAADGGGVVWVALYENDQLVRADAGTLARLSTVNLPAGSGPYRIALGPDGNLWVAEYKANAIDQITPGSVRTRFPMPNPGSGPNEIIAGPDGALWITEYDGNRIARMTTSGVVTNEFPVPTPNSKPWGLTVGPDGAIWFTESAAGRIGRVQFDSGSTGGGPGTGSGTGGVLRDTFAPRFTSALAAVPTRFRVGKSATSVSAKKAAPIGTRLRFSLSEPAAVTITFLQPRSGRKVNGICRAPTRSNRKKNRCTRYVSVGSLRRRGLTGANAVAFSGRIGKRALAPGRYVVSAVAKDAAGNVSKASTRSITIVTS